MPSENVIEKIFEQGISLGDKPALIYKKGTRYLKVSFKEFWEGVIENAASLQKKGVQKGDRVLVFVPMSLELYQTVLSLLYIGASAVFLDAWTTRNRLETACGIVKPKVFIGSAKAHLLRLMSSAIRKIPLKLRGKFFSSTSLNRQSFPPAFASKDSEALVAFTTGSTGIPKAANRTHGFLWDIHTALKKHLHPDFNTVDLPTLPLFVLNNLVMGISSVLPDFNPARPADIKPEKIISQMEKCSVTSSLGSPAFYEILAGFILKNNITLNIKNIYLGGAPVFPVLARKLKKAFPKTTIEIIYGSTEAEPISGILAEELLGSDILNGLPAGKKVDFIEVQILKPADEPIVLKENETLDAYLCAPGEVGEIVVSGDHVLKYYVDSPEAFRENKIEENGKIWHRTGDAGKINDRGEIFLFGRVKNRFTYQGETLYPLPIEQKLMEIKEIAFAALLPYQEKINLFAEPKEKTEGKAIEQLKKKIRESLKGFNPDQLIILSHIPRDPRHHSKANYEELKKLI